MARLNQTTCKALIFLALHLAISPLQARPKTDVIYMKNGDRITCEIKSMEKGQLAIKIDYMIGTHLVDWSEVERIESSQQFQVLWSDGDLSTGILKQDLEDREDATRKTTRKLIVESDQALDERNPEEAVFVEQLGQNFWEQLYAGIDFGLAFQKDNNQRQATINGHVGRLDRKRWADASVDSFFSGRTDAEDSNRHEGKLLYLHFLSDAWFLGGQVDFLHSTQQQLDLRTTAAGVGGRLLVREPDRILAVAGGLVLNRERFFTEESATNNWEAVVGTRFKWFRFDSTDFHVGFTFYPGISQEGRYRILFDTSAYLDLWGDLYVRFSVFDNFDSRPPTDTPRNDMGGATTVGWSF